MKIKDLITKLQAFNPEAEVWQEYDGMVKPIMVMPATEQEIENFNETKNPETPITYGVLFFAG